MSWTVIVPVKRLELAKTRLRALTDADRDRLALAMALDAAHAALACPVVGHVVVVTSDAVATAAAVALGADVIPDVPDAGLNPALAYAAQQVRPRGVTTTPALAAIAADLPALRPEELTGALRAAERVAEATPKWIDPRRAFVADAAGTGTVLLAAPPGIRLEPCFGANSAAAHAASGALALEGAWPGLRRDVDTPDDLTEAIGLGIGERTAAVLGQRTGAVLVSVDANAALDVKMSGDTHDGTQIPADTPRSE